MKTTINDVAIAAGVSKATVSKVLNNTYPISEETSERVRKTAKELGYNPNRRAQSFATKQTKNILFLAEMKQGIGFDNPHLFEMLAGAEQTLSRKGYGLIMKHTDAKELSHHPENVLSEEYVDGAILHASVVSKEVAHILENTDLPYIVVGMPSFQNQLCWIDTDNSVAGKIAATHLMECGCRKIAFIGSRKEDMISSHRLNGVLEAIGRKMPNEYLCEGVPTREGGEMAIKKLLKLETPPDAVICANQYIAFGCVSELKEQGICIPEDMAVITFDDFPFSRALNPQLTVVNLDMYEIGSEAAKITLRRIRKPQLVVQSQTTLPLLIERRSTIK